MGKIYLYLIIYIPFCVSMYPQEITETGFASNNNIYALTEYNNELYCAISKNEGGPNTGRVYRFNGENWKDAGKLGSTEWIYSLTIYDNQLYASTGFPGKVYRYDGDDNWVDIGHPGNTNHVRCLYVFNNHLYAGCTGSVYRYTGNTNWKYAGNLGKDNMVHSLIEYNGKLVGGGYFTKRVYFYDGDTTWTETDQFEETGSYLLSLAHFNGCLYAATGGGCLSSIFCYDKNNKWTNVGTLGTWNSSLIVFNGNLYAGTNNGGAKLYKYHNKDEWLEIASFHPLEQVWAMALFNGELYISAGNPFNYFGKIFSINMDILSNNSEKAANSYYSGMDINNYPNPFNASTTITYKIEASLPVFIKIFNVNGQEIECLVNEEQKRGKYEINWYPQKLSSGIYLCTINAGSYGTTRKIVLIK